MAILAKFHFGQIKSSKTPLCVIWKVIIWNSNCSALSPDHKLVWIYSVLYLTTKFYQIIVT